MKKVVYTGEVKQVVKLEVPQDIVDVCRKAGMSDSEIGRHYAEVKDNPWVCSHGLVKCDLCGQKRVLMTWDGCSPPGECVNHPSSEIRYWAGYSYPQPRVHVCKWCHPKQYDKRSRVLFLHKLFKAMIENEKHNWDWIKEHHKDELKGGASDGK